MTFELPELPYDYNALEPHIDEETMRLHHDKHHAGYTKKFNAALEGKNISGSAEEIIAKLNELPEDIRTAVRNNGGGYVNHKLFWTVMGPGKGGEPSGELKAAIEKAFGSFKDFKEKFTTAAATRFGSGWAWLCVKGDSLEICSTPNQDSPLTPGTGCGGTPILGLDVWEHAYYKKYGPGRADYISAWWNVVNWEEVARRLKEAQS